MIKKNIPIAIYPCHATRMSGYTIASASYLRTYFNGYGYYNVKTSKLKIYLRPFNAYAVQFYDTFQRTRIPLTGRYLIYELTKVQ